MTKRRPPRSLQEYLDGPPKVTQEELATKVGVHQTTISLYLSDDRRPSAERALLLHKATGVALTTILAIGRPAGRPRGKRSTGKPLDVHHDYDDDGSADPLADRPLPLETRRQPLRAGTVSRVSQRPHRLRHHGAA